MGSDYMRSRVMPRSGRLLRNAAVVFASVGLISAMPGVFQRAASAGSSLPSPPFTECPAVGYNVTCSLLVDVTNSGTFVLVDPNATVAHDPAPGTYDGVDDTLVGIVNNSSSPVTSVKLSSTTDAFHFDDDGICQNPNSTSHLAGLTCGTHVVHGSEYSCNYPHTGDKCVDNDNPDDTTGYGGPDAYYSDISSNYEDGTVNFVTAIPPGSSGNTSYFSLENDLTPSSPTNVCQDTIVLTPTTATQTVGIDDTVTATLTNIATSAPVSGVTVTFTIVSGPNAGHNATATTIPVAGHPNEATTDSNGTATFTYGSTLEGTDTIQATYDDPGCGTQSLLVPATVTWLAVSSTVTTTASPASDPVGVTTTVDDVATFAAPSTGSVSFTLYSDSLCSTPVATGTAGITTTGGVSSATFQQTNFTPATVGTYYWIATPTSSPPSNANACGEASESMVVTPPLASPTIATAANPTSVTVGTGTVGDTATFSATSAGGATGTVDFTLYSNDTCVPSATVFTTGDTVPISANGAAVPTPPPTPATAGTYYWQVTYDGDANNNPAQSDCSAEPVVVYPRRRR